MRKRNLKRRNILYPVLMCIVLSLSACRGNDDGTNQNANEENENTNEQNQNQEAGDDLIDEIEDLGEDIVDDITGEEDEEVGDDFEAVNFTVSGWEIEIEDMIRDKILNNVSIELGYTDASTNEFVKEAQEGNEFFLLKLNVRKADSKETFQWDNLVLSDEEGNTYNRVEDTFLTDLDLKRMPGTDLNFGSNDGWIAFEIPEGASGLTIQYEFEEDTLEYTFED